jgi:hypothetical protein
MAYRVLPPVPPGGLLERSSVNCTANAYWNLAPGRILAHLRTRHAVLWCTSTGAPMGKSENPDGHSNERDGDGHGCKKRARSRSRGRSGKRHHREELSPSRSRGRSRGGRHRSPSKPGRDGNGHGSKERSSGRKEHYHSRSKERSPSRSRGRSRGGRHRSPSKPGRDGKGYGSNKSCSRRGGGDLHVTQHGSRSREGVPLPPPPPPPPPPPRADDTRKPAREVKRWRSIQACRGTMHAHLLAANSMQLQLASTFIHPTRPPPGTPPLRVSYEHKTDRMGNFKFQC